METGYGMFLEGRAFSGGGDSVESPAVHHGVTDISKLSDRQTNTTGVVPQSAIEGLEDHESVPTINGGGPAGNVDLTSVPSLETHTISVKTMADAVFYVPPAQNTNDAGTGAPSQWDVDSEQNEVMAILMQNQHTNLHDKKTPPEKMMRDLDEAFPGRHSMCLLLARLDLGEAGGMLNTFASLIATLESEKKKAKRRLSSMLERRATLYRKGGKKVSPSMHEVPGWSQRDIVVSLPLELVGFLRAMMYLVPVPRIMYSLVETYPGLRQELSDSLKAFPVVVPNVDSWKFPPLGTSEADLFEAGRKVQGVHIATLLAVGGMANGKPRIVTTRNLAYNELDTENPCMSFEEYDNVYAGREHSLVSPETRATALEVAADNMYFPLTGAESHQPICLLRSTEVMLFHAAIMLTTTFASLDVMAGDMQFHALPVSVAVKAVKAVKGQTPPGGGVSVSRAGALVANACPAKDAFHWFNPTSGDDEKKEENDVVAFTLTRTHQEFRRALAHAQQHPHAETLVFSVDKCLSCVGKPCSSILDIEDAAGVRYKADKKDFHWESVNVTVTGYNPRTRSADATWVKMLELAIEYMKEFRERLSERLVDGQRR